MRDQPPAPQITLRPLTRADAPALQEVYVASEAYFVQTAGTAPAPAQAEYDLTEAASDAGRFLLGIALRDELVGVLDLRLAAPGPYDVRLGLILLRPASRRQGLGSWALRILEEWLRQATPSEAMVLTLPAHDHAAQAFFTAHRYAFTGQSTRVLAGHTRLRLLEMRKSL
ncbi:MAG: GNAT family N-acetyltransferase [Anaerolineae bacterium]